MIYFSYGSNMSSRRLLARISTADRVGVAELFAHELRFHKVSDIDGSAKCDACYTGDPLHVVHGVLFDISESARVLLDTFEGVGCGYMVKAVRVRLAGTTLDAFTYVATSIDAELRPFHWYKEHVLQGAREHCLPQAYIHKLERVVSVPDPDEARHVRELEIYRCSVSKG